MNFFKENFLLFITALIFLSLRAVTIFVNINDIDNGLRNIILLTNTFDFTVYFFVIITLFIKYFFLRFAIFINRAMYVSYPLDYIESQIESEINTFWSIYRFVTYPFRFNSRKIIFNIIAESEVMVYLQLLNEIKESYSIRSKQTLSAFWLKKLREVSVKSSIHLEHIMELPSEFIQYVFSVKDRNFHTLYSFVKVQNYHTTYDMNNAILNLFRCNLKEYFKALPEIVDKINGKSDYLTFTVIDKDRILKYCLGNNNVEEFSKNTTTDNNTDFSI